jgi:flavorubredoxin
MRETAKALKISEDVYWVGAVDWGIRDMHGYNTERGTTYNAYLIKGEKNILIDTVKGHFFDEMISRISSVLPPSAIDYIVSNHSEMDHSGVLVKTAGAVSPEKIFCSKNGADALSAHFHGKLDLTAVKSGETMRLGNKTLTFIETKMLHWPDSMFTYLRENKILFSQDAFGMHLATKNLFDDEIPDYVLEWEAEKYYANILMPSSALVLKLLAELPKMNLDISMIAVDHGPIWRTKINKILSLYKKWAEQKPEDKAVVIFDTMWGSTASMASAVADGVSDSGSDVKILPLNASHRSDIAAELLSSGAMAVGSPTLNNNIFPTLADTLVYLKGLKPKNKIGAVFGSYGWSGESTKYLSQILEDMKVEIVGDAVKARYVPDTGTLFQCSELGKKISETLKRKLQN